jgi:tight adherence protein B
VGERRTASAASGHRLRGDPGAVTATELVRRLAERFDGAGPARWWRDRRSAAERERRLPELVDAVARAMGSGASLGRALEDAADVVGEPFTRDVARLTRRVAAGVGLAQALERWADEDGGADLRLVVTACVLGAEAGRGTADALLGVAATLGDRRDVVAEARALSSQARASAVLLVALPLVFVVGTAFVDPTTTRSLLTTRLGWACLLGGLTLDAVGAWWMRRIVGGVV